METFYIFNLKTNKASKRSWKTYSGAEKNIKDNEIVTTKEGIEWALRNPDWSKIRLILLERLNENKKSNRAIRLE